MTLHVLVCFVLIIVIMLQSGNAADLAGAFGGAGSQTAFGPRGAATFLSKATTWCAIVFMMTSHDAVGEAHACRCSAGRQFGARANHQDGTRSAAAKPVAPAACALQRPPQAPLQTPRSGTGTVASTAPTFRAALLRNSGFCYNL